MPSASSASELTHVGVKVVGVEEDRTVGNDRVEHRRSRLPPGTASKSQLLPSTQCDFKSDRAWAATAV